jgi:IS5 family transposase
MAYSFCHIIAVAKTKEQAMRTKSLRQAYLDFTPASSTKVVEAYRRKYRTISEVLDENPKLLTAAHRDLDRVLSTSREGRRSGHTTEQILRALVVMFVEGASYRDTVVRIANSEFLRDFVRLGPSPVMDFTFLCKAFGALSERTWQTMNRMLAQYARREERISPEKVRVDTTAYETNIHYPTDSSLLWDSFRTLAWLLKEAGPELRRLGMRHRFHMRKVKKLAQDISRNAAKQSKGERRRIRGVYGTLIERVRWIAAIAREASVSLRGLGLRGLAAAHALAHFVPLVERIIDQAERRIFFGEIVPADEKVYSLFEEHTELLKRGKAGKPVEFGHKILLAETGEKFILHYNVYQRQPADKDLVNETLAAHRTLFLHPPDTFAGDKGFYASPQQFAALENTIPAVSIGKKGRRNAEEYAREHTEAFQAGQRFRAGSEGTISVLKRAFKLNRCLFKGFKNYAASVGCAVFCHNLVMLARC